MREFQPFEMERLMSKYEQDAEYNLSESGVHPMRTGELLDASPGALDELLATELGYPHVNGTPQLRERIAALYPGALAGDVLVTVGAIEANYITIRTLAGSGDGIAVMLPNYMQIWGIAKNHDLRMTTFSLKEEDGWALDLDELETAVTDQTRVVAVCNPNNPTGRILSEAEMDAVVAAARRVDAWILADEVYAGAERESDEETPSFHGRYEKVIAVGSMSKAYGLPGLRLGWAVGPATTLDEIWARHEYTTLAASTLSNQLAAIALGRKVRKGILARTRGLIRRGYAILEEWMARQDGMLRLTPPQAAAIAFVRYDLEINSTELVERMHREKGVLVVPGDSFGLDRHLRISFGLPPEVLVPALQRIGEMMAEVARETGAPAAL